MFYQKTFILGLKIKNSKTPSPWTSVDIDRLSVEYFPEANKFGWALGELMERSVGIDRSEAPWFDGWLYGVIHGAGT
jgi:hypothetical protein